MKFLPSYLSIGVPRMPKAQVEFCPVTAGHGRIKLGDGESIQGKQMGGAEFPVKRGLQTYYQSPDPRLPWRKLFRASPHRNLRMYCVRKKKKGGFRACSMDLVEFF